MGDDEVKKLADTLKKQGLAVSTYEAMEKAKRILGFKPKVGFEEGIKRTVEWYKGHFSK